MSSGRMFPKFLLRNGWSPWHWVGATLLAGVGMLVTWDAWRDIRHIAFRDEESSHILVVPLVIAWLVWVRRHRLRHCRPEGMWIGPVLVAAGWLLYSLGDTWLIQSFWHGGAVLLVTGCFLTAVGKDMLRKFAPAFVALLFLVPVPGRVRQNIAMPMGTASAHVTQHLLWTTGINVERRGNLLSLEHVDITIAEACNGLRMVAALGLVSYAFAFGTPLRWYARAVILVATPISALLCNVIRLVPTIWLYDWWPWMGKLFHDVSGWAMLVLSFLILLAVLRLLRWAMVPVEQYVLAYD